MHEFDARSHKHLSEFEPTQVPTNDLYGSGYASIQSRLLYRSLLVTVY